MRGPLGRRRGGFDTHESVIGSRVCGGRRTSGGPGGVVGEIWGAVCKEGACSNSDALVGTHKKKKIASEGAINRESRPKGFRGKGKKGHAKRLKVYTGKKKTHLLAMKKHFLEEI